MAEVIDQFLMPAIVANRYQEVLAANPIARALSPEFAPGKNFLRWRLLDRAAQELYVTWTRRLLAQWMGCVISPAPA